MRSYAKLALGAMALTVSAFSSAAPNNYRTNYPLPTTQALSGAAVNVRSATVTQQDIQAISAAGFKYVRMDLWWINVEPAKGQYNFSRFDNIMSWTQAAGLRVDFVLDAGNLFYTPTIMTLPSTPAAQQAYINYATAAVNRYQGQGVLWEIFNEPDGSNLSASAYTSLAHCTIQSIRSVAPQEWILGPSISSISTPNALAYLQTCMSQGLLSDLDGLSVHPYNSNAPETMAGQFKALKAQLASFGYPNMPIMATEWGYPTASLPANLTPSPYQVGGVNTLAVPNTFSNWTWHGYYNKPSVITGVPDPVGGNNATRALSSDWSTNANQGFSGFVQLGNLFKGHTYTASVWLRSTGAPFTVYMGLNDGDAIGFQINNTWQRYSFSLVDHDKWNQGRMLQIWENTVGNPSWDVYGAQLEDNGFPNSTTFNSSVLSLQGQFMVRSYQSCLNAGIPYTCLYEWKESPQAPGCGLNWADMTPKPAMVDWETYAGTTPSLKKKKK